MQTDYLTRQNPVKYCDKHRFSPPHPPFSVSSRPRSCLQLTAFEIYCTSNIVVVLPCGIRGQLSNKYIISTSLRLELDVKILQYA